MYLIAAKRLNSGDVVVHKGKVKTVLAVARSSDKKAFRVQFEGYVRVLSFDSGHQFEAPALPNRGFAQYIHKPVKASGNVSSTKSRNA